MNPDFVGTTLAAAVLLVFGTVVILHAIDAAGRPHTGRSRGG